MPSVTVASWECPAVIRRGWFGRRSPDYIVQMLAEFFSRVHSDPLLIWR